MRCRLYSDPFAELYYIPFLTRQCIYASLVKIHPLLQKIKSRNETKRMRTPTGSAPKPISPHPPHTLPFGCGTYLRICVSKFRFPVYTQRDKIRRVNCFHLVVVRFDQDHHVNILSPVEGESTMSFLTAPCTIL